MARPDCALRILILRDPYLLHEQRIRYSLRASVMATGINLFIDHKLYRYLMNVSVRGIINYTSR